jgi:hypothetical protein
VHVTLSPATEFAKTARLHVAQPAAVEGVGIFAPGELPLERGAWVIALGDEPVTITLQEVR